VTEYGKDVEGATEHPNGIAVISLRGSAIDCFAASLSHVGILERRLFGILVRRSYGIWYSIPSGGTIHCPASLSEEGQTPWAK
jgi:hypothetical protein